MYRSVNNEILAAEFVIYQQTISKNIKYLRHLKYLSQEKLGLHANVDRTLVSKIERCLANPSLEILTKLALCLDVPIGVLFLKS